MVEWSVLTVVGKPCGVRWEWGGLKAGPRPKFVPRAGSFMGAQACFTVDDGWLIGFNQGEFGAELHWFSDDGKRNYKISDHQVVTFLSRADGIYAIEGLAHLGLSLGSVIRIARPKAGARWQASTFVKLPAAPYAVSTRRDGTMLVTLSNSLVSVGPDRKMETLLGDAPWGGLYPNSSILSADEERLYIGMRQFVGEYDFTTNKLRLLIPSKAFLNKLPKDEEKRIRESNGR